MRKFPTRCCALAQLGELSNDTPIDNIEWALELLKRQKDENTEVGVSTGNGQTSIFAIVSHGEDVLEANLLKLGFTEVWQFERRKGYPKTGDNKMLIINL